MVKVHFRNPDGTRVDCEIAEGMNLMEAALNNGVDGVIADCGGALSCATCHVYVDPIWFDRLEPRSAEETDMIEFAVEARPTSRLSCQIVLTADCDGLIVEVPQEQSSA